MYASDSIILIQGPFGRRIPCYKPAYGYVYLLHFSQPYKHARHYLGSTCDLEQRLQLHRNGRGARLMEVVAAAGIGFEVCRLWRFNTGEEARAYEKVLKHRHSGLRLCPYCTGKPVDTVVAMRQGHWPFHLFTHQSKRRASYNSLSVLSFVSFRRVSQGPP